MSLFQCTHAGRIAVIRATSADSARALMHRRVRNDLRSIEDAAADAATAAPGDTTKKIAALESAARTASACKPGREIAVVELPAEGAEEVLVLISPRA